MSVNELNAESELLEKVLLGHGFTFQELWKIKQLSYKEYPCPLGFYVFYNRELSLIIEGCGYVD